VFLLNLKQDIVLFELDSGKSAVTSLSFRTDNGGGDNPCPVLASGCADGKIWIWDLAGKKLVGEVAAPLGAHEGRILSASFLPQEPVSVVYEPMQIIFSCIYMRERRERGSLFTMCMDCCFFGYFTLVFDKEREREGSDEYLNIFSNNVHELIMFTLRSLCELYFH
jgi:hypothetical protein